MISWTILWSSVICIDWYIVNPRCDINTKANNIPAIFAKSIFCLIFFSIVYYFINKKYLLSQIYILCLFWYLGWDLNPHSRRKRILNPPCLPFHHPGWLFVLYGLHLIRFANFDVTLFPIRDFVTCRKRDLMVEPAWAGPIKNRLTDYVSLCIIVKKIIFQFF